MKFRSGYQGSYQFNQARKLQEQMEKKRKEDRMETIGMAILIPLGFFGMLVMYCLLWAITPPHWW